MGPPGGVLRRVIAVAWFAILLVVTLSPGSAESVGGNRSLPSICFVCGEQGSADAFLNVLLFVPLGLVLGVSRGVLTAVAGGVLLSTSVEAAQLLFLPARHASLRDVVMNGLGAGLGASSVPVLGRLLRGSATGIARTFAVMLPSAYLLTAGVLMEPVRSDERYFGEWTPESTVLETYRGQVVSASLNGEPIPRGPFPSSAEPDRELQGNWVLEVRMVKGPPPPSLAPIVRLYADRGILLIGADREDLVWHERTRAQEAGFRYADPRLRGGLARYPAGDTISIGARRVDAELCLTIESEEACGLGVAMSRSWTLLIPAAAAPPRFLILLDLAWMAALFALVGLVGGRPLPTVWLALLAMSFTYAAAAATPLMALGWAAWTGAALGTAGGAALRPLARLFIGLPVAGYAS